MRFVPDSNILISAVFWGGIPGKILELTQRSDCILLSSEALLDELLDVLQRGKFAERLRVLNKTPVQFLQDYRALVEVVDVIPLRCLNLYAMIQMTMPYLPVQLAANRCNCFW